MMLHALEAGHLLAHDGVSLGIFDGLWRGCFRHEFYAKKCGQSA
jgi:hypothetical protein